MSWWRWGGIPARIFVKLDDGSDTGQLIFGSSYDTRFPTSVYEYDPDSCNDHLNDIPYYLWTPEFDCGEAHLDKRFEFVNIDFDDYNGGVTVEWECDGGLRSGSFVANIPIDRNKRWGSLTDITAKWNNALGQIVNGLIWTIRKSYALTYKLPQAAHGKRIRFGVSADASGFTPAKFNVVSIGFSPKKQIYGKGTR